MALSESIAVHDLLESLLRKILAHPQALQIVAKPSPDGVSFNVLVNPQDAEKLSGRGVVTVRALRTILRAAGVKHGHEYSLVLESHPELLSVGH